jgi:hypothetical protein
VIDLFDDGQGNDSIIILKGIGGIGFVKKGVRLQNACLSLPSLSIKEGVPEGLNPMCAGVRETRRKQAIGVYDGEWAEKGPDSSWALFGRIPRRGLEGV